MAEREFLFLTCQPGAEQLVKRDIAARSPGMRFAFSRPGFLTFRSDEAVTAEVPRPTYFARAWGSSLGRAATVADATSMLGTVDGVHAFVRDARPLDELEADPWEAERALREELGVHAGAAEARAGDLVGDIVLVDPGQFWLGLHRHDASHRAVPGGRPPRFSSPHAPSRVWAKIEEAIWRTGRVVDANSHILDIGCAPGGGTLNLLDRGAWILGVDPAEMSPAVRHHAQFEHRAVAFETLDPATLPRTLDGFVFDVNLSPRLTLGALKSLLRELPGVEWGFVTLKLNKLEHVDHVDWMLGRLHAAGFATPIVEQLFHNRQELFVYAIR